MWTDGSVVLHPAVILDIVSFLDRFCSTLPGCVVYHSPSQSPSYRVTNLLCLLFPAFFTEYNIQFVLSVWFNSSV